MKQILVILIVVNLLIGCTASRYNIAENHLEQGRHQSALREYLKILHEDKRQHGGFTDAEAMLGVASTYFAMKQYGKTQSMCKRILKIDANNGGALFYAGGSLEAKGKLKWAVKFYNRHKFLPDSDPYKRFMKARLEFLMQEEIAKSMKAAIRRERTVRPDDVPQNTIAVLYFLNQDADPDWQALSKGLAEMMITDFAQAKQLNVVERLKLQKLIDEMNMDQSGLADPNTVPRFGKLLKARILINGGYTIPSGADLMLTANIGDITQSRTFEALRFSGRLENIFRMEKDLVLSVLDQLGIQLSYEERNRIMQIPTENIQAFKAYCFGLEQMDRGNYTLAGDYFNQSLKLDPKFSPANEKLQLVEAMGVLASNRPIAASIRKHKARRGSARGSGQLGVLFRPSPENRLSRISSNLDMGYLPGNNSREDAAELGEDLLERRPLLPPPDPPRTTQQ
ncbi:hypothetical protein JXJ21_13945 [candidate division KSB1 bacterium]|nr:hypothetical protein [candidate division KSB1 bacterium]